MIRNTKETFIDNISKITDAKFGDIFFVSDDIDDYNKRQKCFIIAKDTIFFSQKGEAHSDVMQRINDTTVKNYFLGNIMDENNISIQEIVEEDNFFELKNIAQSIKYIKTIRKFFPNENIFFSTFDLKNNNYFLIKVA